MTTKISVISDLHLEMTMPYEGFNPNDDSTMLVVAGDLMNLAQYVACSTAEERDIEDEIDDHIWERYGEYNHFLDTASENYEHVIYVPGNHEFYGAWFMGLLDELQDILDKRYGNIHVMERRMDVFNGVVFIGSTLWTVMDKESPLAMIRVQDALNDFRKIFLENKLASLRMLRAEHVVAYHRASMNTLDIMLDIAREDHPDMPVVVVTHHAPSYRSVAEKYKGSIINAGFASELDEFIAKHDHIGTWIHGHMHDPVDYMIHNTRVIANPRGYDSERYLHVDVSPIQIEV